MRSFIKDQLFSKLILQTSNYIALSGMIESKLIKVILRDKFWVFWENTTIYGGEGWEWQVFGPL